jgi:nitroimidazol reductase NimA-like FMN-containing flavoprotein (pyridoxamine 5'-phosphate oxidase superfamily)
MDVDRNGLGVLDRRECLRLLGGERVGRVGVTLDALPVILPVTFRLVGEDVVFSSGAGAKLRAATDGAVIAFEVDRVDLVSHAGWSVLVTGIGRVVVDEAEEDRLWSAGVPRWLPGDGARLVVLGTGLVSGRRLAPVGEASPPAPCGWTTMAP